MVVQRRTEGQRLVCNGSAWSVRFEYPERFGSADCCGEGDRPEVTTVERGRLVRIHEEDVTGGDYAASLPGRERASAAIALAGGAHVGSIDRDGEANAADGLSGQRENVLDERHAAGEITAVGKVGRERLRRICHHKRDDGQLPRRLHRIEPSGNAFGGVPNEARARLR